MAQLTRPLTEGEARAILENWRVHFTPMVDSWWRTVWEAAEERRHFHFVRYDAKLDRVVLEDPQMFYSWNVEPSPSDSRWMVPK